MCATSWDKWWGLKHRYSSKPQRGTPLLDDQLIRQTKLGKIIDYAVYSQTGNMQAALEAARQTFPLHLPDVAACFHTLNKSIFDAATTNKPTWQPCGEAAGPRPHRFLKASR